jgi:hypothetical protein
MAGRGSAPGERRGGRTKGTLDRKSLERHLLQEHMAKALADDDRRKLEALSHLERQARMTAETYSQIRREGKALAKDSLALFLEIFMGRAAHYQPRPRQDDRAEQNPHANEELFEKWARLSVECAKYLAPYQSPTFRAIVVTPPPPPQQANETRRFTLAVFESNGQSSDGQGNGHDAATAAAIDEVAHEDEPE